MMKERKSIRLRLVAKDPDDVSILLAGLEKAYSFSDVELGIESKEFPVSSEPKSVDEQLEAEIIDDVSESLKAAQTSAERKVDLPKAKWLRTQIHDFLRYTRELGIKESIKFLAKEGWDSVNDLL